MEASILFSRLKRRHGGREKAVKSPEPERAMSVTGREIRELATVRQLSSGIGQITAARCGLLRAARQLAEAGQIRLPPEGVSDN